MREKDKLNFKTIKNMTEISSWRRLFLIGTKGAEGIGGGLGVGGLVITILALSGITAAFVFEVVAAVAGAAVFGVLAVILAGYQLWKDQKRINSLKNKFDHQVGLLKQSVVELSKNYQLLDEISKNVENEIMRLNSIALEIYVQEEQERIKKKIQELNLELQNLEQIKQDLIAKLRIVLDVVTGSTYSEKLTHLFGRVNDEEGSKAIVNYAEKYLKLPDMDVDKVKLGITKLWHDLSDHQTTNIKTDTFKNEFNQLITPEKDKTHRGIKRATYALTAAGGFLGGVGITITVGALIFGGIAALTAIGWPVLVVALAVGATTMVGAFLYYRYIEKKQQKTLKQMELAVTQVTGMGSYIQNNINKPTLDKVNQINETHSQAIKEVAIRLDEHEKCFREYQKLVHEQHHRVKSIENEIKIFTTYSTMNLKMLGELKDEININIMLLESLEKRIAKIAVLAGSEDKKINLLKEVTDSKAEAQEIYEVTQKVYILVDKSLHKQQIHLNKKHEKLVGKNWVDEDIKNNLPKNENNHEDEEEGSESPDVTLM